MSGVERAAARGVRATGVRAGPRRAPTPAELAWVALIPCALVTLAAIVLPGPPLGHALFKPGGDVLWPPGWWEARGSPEPVEHGRFLLALLGPLLLAAAVLAGARRPPPLRPWAIRATVYAGQACLLALVVAAVLGQRDVLLDGDHSFRFVGVGTLAPAAGIVAVAVLALRWGPLTAGIARLARERTATRVACAVLAAAFAATWLIEALETDGLVEDIGLMNWTLNDAFAVLNGRTPLVDFHLLYAKLLPYPAALALLAFGTTGLVYTLFMTVLSLLALLAVYAVLRRIVHSSLLALGLFIPFVALGDEHHTMIMPAMWPMRYGGAYLLAWLTARQLDGSRPRRAWVLFLIAGLVTLNDLEFGVAALLASVVALLCARPPRSVRDALPLAGAVAAGTLGAIAIVCAFTLVRAGALPSLDLLLEWPHVFTNLGWFSLAMPTLGLHLAIYATFAAALAVAAVRLARAADDVLLTSMLAWAGVFGLLAGSYYAGRSDDLKLASMFSAWAFALALLTVVCVRALTARGWRAPTLPELLVLFAFALAICKIGGLVSPRMLIERLRAPTPPPAYRPAAEQFVVQHVHRGQKVAILLPESYRIAYEVGVENVAPYGISNAIVTREQMRTLIDTIERERVKEIFLPAPGSRLVGEADTAPEQLQLLEREGFEQGASSAGMLELRRTGR